MIIKKQGLKIGIIGCGAIGSRIANFVAKDLKGKAILSGIFDIDQGKSSALASEINKRNIIKHSLKELIKSSNFIFEATSAKISRKIARRCILSGRDVMIMSVGGMIDADDVFSLAKRKNCKIHIPSGAISGLDAVKAAHMAKITKITLTTRKPPHALTGVEYLKKRKIKLDLIRKETTLFEGSVRMATKLFPKNINVAAALGLASGIKEKVTIRLITSPKFTTNSHEVEVMGDFGKLVSKTENVACPDNPKTSYLAVLSAIATLKGILSEIKIGT